MLPSVVLDRFVEHCPAAVMLRATLEHLLRPERLDEIFEQSSDRQYQGELLFSELVALMAGVATRAHRSVHAAYLEARERLGVSPAALYGKLSRLEPGISEALVSRTARDAAAAIDALPGGRPELLPGYEVRFLDGNHPAATQHRLAELRGTREGPLPGQALAVLDARRDLIVELILCEDGHAQERSLLGRVLERTPPKSVTAADRNFCTTKFLFGLAERLAHFVIRQHASTLTWRLLGRRRCRGRGPTGLLFEQDVELSDGERRLRLRRVTVRLDKPTQAGDAEIHILTNLPKGEATPLQVAEVYRSRWTIEGAFQKLTDVLRCEVETLGYPRAALFSFAAAVLAYNSYAVAKAALRSAQGAAAVDEGLSDYHLVHDVVLTVKGMAIALGPGAWVRYGRLTAAEFAAELLALAGRVKLSRYPKKKRGPKKPPPKKKSGKRNHHISTARTLAKSRGNRTC